MWWFSVALASDASTDPEPVEPAGVPASLTLVLHRSTDPRVSVAARMLTAAQQPSRALDIQGLRAWSQAVGPRFDGGTATGCVGDPVPLPELVERAQTARQRFVSLDFQAAEERLYRFDRDFACADGVLPQDVLAGAFLVRGVLEFTQGDAEAAAAAFRDARSFDPELAFDGALAPAARSAFDAAKPPLPEAWIRIVPPPSRVWVDGEVVTYGERGVHVAPGRHLITAEYTATASADLRVEGSGTLFLPGVLGDRTLSELTAADRRSAVLAALDAAGVRSAWLTDLDSIWKLEGGAVTPIVGASLPEDRKGKKKAKKTKG